MKYNIVAPLGEDLESIYTAVREFPTEKIYLLSTGKHRERLDELKAVADKLRIGVQVIDIKGGLLEGMFKIFAQMKSAVDQDSLLVNVSSGDNLVNCAALSASYVNGLKAMAVMDDKLIMLPVLKFSYYRLLPERKLAILKFLKDQPDCCSSLEELAARTKMSLPLVSYHVNGNAKAEGLITMGLAATHIGPRGKTQVMLTELGKLISVGDIEAPSQAALPHPEAVA
ncbi:MAG: winged helix-turn-helix domain-containing protein [Nitrososphaerota archaeon]|nr:winged helix-turn-helix domain-containing protein [Nitrososphaerota archaeon]MDG6980594.1 winged helix-turn-helix domain-containing protein [Nitrososphaerota archaeon]MDG6983672.1 winged helix-turn-helix domain-containing protein [Nitrososphaerota archaeon]